MATVYIETSVPSFYVETRQSPTVVSWREATRTWWDNHRHRYRLVTSALVLHELAAGLPFKAEPATALIKDLPLLEALPGLEDVIDYYIQHQLMPAGAGGDAGHLALASMHGVDFLLTWNCKHLANANKIQHLRILNGRLGLSVPTITTPLNLVPEDPS
jgi:predicted nucleic acid-binding protein